MTERRTPKQRAAHMAELLAEVAAQSLAEDAEQAGKPTPTTEPHDITLRLTPEQASTFLLVLERDLVPKTRWPGREGQERDEMVAVWTVGRQLRAAGITTSEDDEGQGRA